MSIETIYLEEDRYNDKIFNTINDDGGTDIYNNIYYNNTHVRTWYYSNIESDIWVLDNEIPLLAEYNINLFPPAKFDKGLYIVKKYTITRDNISSVKFIDRYIQNSSEISEEVKSKTINYLNEAVRDITPKNNVNIRLVTFIPYGVISKRGIVKYKNYSISTNIDNLFKGGMDEIKCGCLSIEIEVSSDDDVVPIYLFNKQINLEPIGGTGDGSTIYHYTLTDLVNEKLISAGSIATNNEETMETPFLDFMSRNDRLEQTAGLKDLYEKYKEERIAEVIRWHKQLLEHEVSVNKATAYGINNDTNVVKLEKEETSKAKDELKIIKDIFL